MNDITLYGASAELANLEKFLEETETLTEEQSKEIQEKTEYLTTFMKEKTDMVCGYAQALTDYINNIDDRIGELETLKKSITIKKDRFDKYVLSALDVLGTKKLSGQLYSITYRAPSKSVEIFNEDLIPPQYMKIKEVVDVDKKQISADLKEGLEVPGARLKEAERKTTYKVGK